MAAAHLLNAPGSGWARLARTLLEQIPAAEIEGVWRFRTLRHDGREWGTAIISRVDGERRRIFTARFVLTLKGRERGKFESVIEEVGSGPLEALVDLLAGVQRRLDEDDPVPVPTAEWFALAVEAPAPPDGPARQG